MRYSMKIKALSKSRYWMLGLAFVGALVALSSIARANSISQENSATGYQPTDTSGKRASSGESSFQSNMSGMSTGSNDSTSGLSMTGSTYSDSTSNVSTSVARNPPGSRVIKTEDANGTSSGTSSSSSTDTNGRTPTEDSPAPAKRP